MACSEILLCLGLVVVFSSVCHCASLTRAKALDKFRESSTLSQGQTKGNDLRHGKLLIGRNSLRGAKHKPATATKNDSDYQADMGWGEKPPLWAEELLNLDPDSAAVDRLLQMEPKVECTANAMQLQVHNAAFTPGSLFFVDRGRRLSPLPLSKLPTSCGHTVRSTGKDLVLVAPYDGCFVTFEEDSYVLPLRWCGLTMRMSCPLTRSSSPDPPMVTCHAGGMVVKTEWTVSVTKIKVKLNGYWEPLMTVSSICGFGVVVHPEGVVISVHYVPCLQKKDGMYTLELAGDGETTISCPSLSSAQLQPAKRPALAQVPYQTPKPQQPAVPQVSPQKPGAPEKPSQKPEVDGQSQYPYYDFYPYYFYPYFENPDPGHPSTAVQPIPTTPPVITTTAGQMRPARDPLPFYVQPPQPGTLPAQPPVNQPASQPVDREEIHPYPFFIYPQPPALKPSRVEQPSENPVQTKPPFSKKPPEQAYDLFHPGAFYHGHLPYGHYQMPIPLKQQTLTPSPQLDTPQHPSPPYVQQPQQVAAPGSNTQAPGAALVQPTYFVPDIQPMSPVYCPQVCPSGFPNCCPQITFHQHLHFVPAGPRSKDTLPMYSAPPLPRSLAHSGFGSGLGSAPRDQVLVDESILLQPRAAGSENQLHLQPPEGVPASLPRSYPRMPTYPYVHNLQYHNWPHQSNNEAQSRRQSAAHYNVLFDNQSPGNDRVYQMGQFEQNGELFSTNEKNANNLHFLPYDKNHHYYQQNKATSRGQQPTNTQSNEPPGLDPSLLPYMPQEPLTSEYGKPMVPDDSQGPLDDGSKKYTEDEQTRHFYSEPNSFVLLPHGPPGGAHYGWNKSPMPFRELVRPENPARHHGNKLQQLDWVGKGPSSLLPGSVSYMPKPGDESERLPSFIPASNGPQFVHLPQDGYSHSKPLFPELFEESMMPPGSSPQFPPRIAGERFPLWSSASDQVNGLNQPLQRGDGQQKLVAFNVN